MLEVVSSSPSYQINSSKIEDAIVTVVFCCVETHRNWYKINTGKFKFVLLELSTFVQFN